MPFSQKTLKLLWGRSAGRCNNRECGRLVTEDDATGKAYLIGENAHVIAQSEDGPRGEAGGGSNEYENLILLCANCHTMIDKASAEAFSSEMLHKWKLDHEAWVSSLGREHAFGTPEELLAFVRGKLNENRLVFENYGPKSNVARDNPASNVADLWRTRKSDTIIPNNRQIVNAVEANKPLLPENLSFQFLRFREHANCYELTEFEVIEDYPLFPKEFDELIRN